MVPRLAKNADRSTNVTIRLSPEERRAWTLAAQAQDRGLSSWLRWLANREVAAPSGRGGKTRAG